MKTALRAVPPILLYWYTTPEVNVGGVAVEAEPSHQHSVTFSCCATVDSRGAV